MTAQGDTSTDQQGIWLAKLAQTAHLSLRSVMPRQVRTARTRPFPDCDEGPALQQMLMTRRSDRLGCADWVLQVPHSLGGR